MLAIGGKIIYAIQDKTREKKTWSEPQKKFLPLLLTGISGEWEFPLGRIRKGGGKGKTRLRLTEIVNNYEHSPTDQNKHVTSGAARLPFDPNARKSTRLILKSFILLIFFFWST